MRCELKDEMQGYTMCILAVSSFSVEISELMDEKARMHIVHHSFFIVQR